jgi:hypothetical protein
VWTAAQDCVSALTGAKKADHAYVVIDDTLIPSNRVADDRPFYSGKRCHGMNLQGISAPSGRSCGSPGRPPAPSTT